MKKFAFVALLMGLCVMGCQKAPENVPENMPAQNEQSSEEVVKTEDSQADSVKADESEKVADTGTDAKRVVERKHIVSHNNAISFEDVGIEVKWLEPEFNTSRGTQNGVFAFLKPGNSRYFLVSEKENAISEKQFADYRAGIFEHIKAISDDGIVYAYDNTADKIGDKLEKMPELSISEMLEVVYTYQGNKVAVYVRYKQYNGGKFVETSKPMYAVYVGVSVIDGVPETE